MQYLIFTYDQDGGYTTSYTNDLPTDWNNLRVFELRGDGLYEEIFPQ